jgi:hypothetical protein
MLFLRRRMMDFKTGAHPAASTALKRVAILTRVIMRSLLTARDRRVIRQDSAKGVLQRVLGAGIESAALSADCPSAHKPCATAGQS